MSLYIRMALYALFTTLSNQGLDIYDPATDQVSFKVEDAALFISGIVGFVVTFVMSRFAAVR